MIVVPSLNVTVPVGVEPPDAETAAVKLTGDARATLGALAVTVVEVALEPLLLVLLLLPLPQEAMPTTIVAEITVANRIIPSTRIPGIWLRRRRGKARIIMAARAESPALPYQAMCFPLAGVPSPCLNNGELN